MNIMSTDKNIVFKRIALLRKQTGLSAQKMADKTGISLTTMQKYEKDRPPSYEFLNALVKELDINPAYFFFDDEPLFLDETKPENNLKELVESQKDTIKLLKEKVDLLSGKKV